MNLIKLHDEVAIMGGLKVQTMILIHHTNVIHPVKKLVEVHDIIDLNMNVQKMFDAHKNAPIWDTSALKDLNRIRCELMVYHNQDFTPFSLLDQFNKEILKFFNIMSLRTQKSPIAN